MFAIKCATKKEEARLIKRSDRRKKKIVTEYIKDILLLCILFYINLILFSYINIFYLSNLCESYFGLSTCCLYKARIVLFSGKLDFFS